MLVVEGAGGRGLRAQVIVSTSVCARTHTCDANACVRTSESASRVWLSVHPDLLRAPGRLPREIWRATAGEGAERWKKWKDGGEWCGVDSSPTPHSSNPTPQSNGRRLHFLSSRGPSPTAKSSLSTSTQPEPFANDITRTSLKECSRQAENWMRSGRPLGFGPIL